VATSVETPDRTSRVLSDRITAVVCFLFSALIHCAAGGAAAILIAVSVFPPSNRCKPGTYLPLQSCCRCSPLSFRY